MESSWILWIAVLLAWTLVGLVVAYLFGGFARRGEASESTTLAPKVVSYLHRQKRPNKPLRSSTHGKVRRAAGGRVRH
ncbi:MAG TPA: hypothetical protein VMI74_08810 [Burkholderiales bacterium]|nr:hypothetical protein [Burkholderiales bacterium]